MVPEGVCEVEIHAFGAQGGAGEIAAATGPELAGGEGQGAGPAGNGATADPGLGGHAAAAVSVTPGESLTVVVGGFGLAGDGLAGGAGGFNGGGDGGDVSGFIGGVFAGGGGGGGRSEVLRSGAPIIVAGGGGGGGGTGTTASAATDGASIPDLKFAGADGGRSGGNGGAGGTGAGTGANDGAGSVAGEGGDGADGTFQGGGGGGGGAVGGGGGGSAGLDSRTGGGGGGDGSGTGPAGVVMENGVNVGDGSVLIRYDDDAGTCEPQGEDVARPLPVQPAFTG